MDKVRAIPVAVPAACSPRFLGRLLGLLGAGQVDTDTLARRLRCDPSVVAVSLEVAAWLGLLRPAASRPGSAAAPRLSRRGLEFLYAGRRRRQVYSEALYANEIVRACLSGRAELPISAQAVLQILRQRAPDLPGSALEQRALALATLLEHSLKISARRREHRPGSQLRLGFPRPRAPVTGYRLRVTAGHSVELEDPAAYRAVLQALLDEGELAVEQVGAVLRELGLPAAPAGVYADTAVRRGDASREQGQLVDQLVITPAAIRRRDLSDTVASVALSDPEYREYLAVLRDTAEGDPSAAARYGRLRTRFRIFDERVFGADQSPRQVAQAVGRLLRGRTLEGIPAAAPGPHRLHQAHHRPFVELLDQPGLVLALPPSIELLVGGLAAVRQALADQRRAPSASVGAFSPRLCVHGGLLHPGEPLPGGIPDKVTLRLHAIERVPHLAFLVALQLQQRVGRGRVGLHLRGERLRIRFRRRDLGPFLPLVDRLMEARGWSVSRRYRGGIGEPGLKDLAESLGISLQAGRAFTLHDDFFWRLRRQPEDRLLHDRLVPLGAWLDDQLEIMLQQQVAAAEAQ